MGRYPGIQREGAVDDCAAGQEKCATDSEPLFRPRFYGTEDGQDPFADGASGAGAEQGDGNSGDANGSADGPEETQMPRRPRGPFSDEMYRAAVDEALAAAAAKPLDHFRSGADCIGCGRIRKQ